MRRSLLPALVAVLLLGVTPVSRPPAPADGAPVATLVGGGPWNRFLCAACVAAFVAVASELTPIAVIAVANSFPWATTGCALQCAIATM